MKEAADFYIENGYVVFTREYHLKRGYCCKNGCRHCPWRKLNGPGNETNKLQKKRL